MILIEVYHPDGRRAYCGPACYNAQERRCACVCRGINHGAGEAQATQNTDNYGDMLIEMEHLRYTVERIPSGLIAKLRREEATRKLAELYDQLHALPTPMIEIGN